MPTRRKASKPLAVDDILSAINSLSDSEKHSLFKRLEESFEDHLGSGYVVVPISLLKAALWLVVVFGSVSTRSIPNIIELESKLQKHRKPKQNADRDAEIMRLFREGKSSGKISQLLKGRWAVTPGAVRIVIKSNSTVTK